MTLIDLSRTIYPGMPKIPVLPEVEFCPVMRVADGHPLNISELRIATHVGTHVDAPWHFDPEGFTIDQLNLERTSGPAVVVPIFRKGGEAIEISDMDGSGVVRDDIVFLSTGWGDRFESSDYGHHPYISEELARWFVETGVKMVGIDCITPDMPVALRPTGFTFPVHHILLDNGVLIIENLVDLDKVAGQKVRVFAFPLKIYGGDAGQARVVAETK